MPDNTSNQGASTGTKMDQAAASRIQSATDKAGGDSGKNSFPARAQAAAAKNANNAATNKK